MPKVVKKSEFKKNAPHSLKVDIFDLMGKPSGKINLPSEIFDVKGNSRLITQVIHIFRSNQRLGTHSSKTRAMVTGSTRKIYKQKGTGRARHGDIKAPIFIGGGVAHGPHPKDYSLSLPDNMKRKALFATLSQKVSQGALKIIDGLHALEPKTKVLAKVLLNFGFNDKGRSNILLVTAKDNKNVFLAGRNIAWLTVKEGNLINTYEVLSAKNILIAKEAISLLEETYFGKKENIQSLKIEKKISRVKPKTTKSEGAPEKKMNKIKRKTVIKKIKK